MEIGISHLTVQRANDTKSLSSRESPSESTSKRAVTVCNIIVNIACITHLLVLLTCLCINVTPVTSHTPTQPNTTIGTSGNQLSRIVFVVRIKSRTERNPSLQIMLGQVECRNPSQIRWIIFGSVIIGMSNR